jgi:hypothetical protein
MKLLQDALDTFGLNSQLKHSVEEASEFVTAFFQWERDRMHVMKRTHLVEEMVDNYLMARQMELAYGKDPMWKAMVKKKTKQLRERIKEEKATKKPSSGKTMADIIEDYGEEWKV